MDIHDKVIRILSGLSGTEDIRPEQELQKDLGLDSLQMVTLLVMLEDEFRILFDEADMNPFDLTIVSQVIALVKKYAGEEASDGSVIRL